MEEFKESIDNNFNNLLKSFSDTFILLLYLKNIIDNAKNEDLIELELDIQNIFINYSYPLDKLYRLKKNIEQIKNRIENTEVDFNILEKDLSKIYSKEQIELLKTNLEKLINND